MVRTRLDGAGQTVVLDSQGPLVVIGERINPSGRKRLAAALAQGGMSMVRQEAIAQVAAGARVIDVNVGAVGVDEGEILPLAVQTVAEAVEVPICIDTSRHAALAAALAVCPGRPLVNSVTGEEASLASVLPLVKERDCAVIGLCINDEGVPKDAQGRLEIAQKIIDRAERLGIAREDVIIDPLATAIGADDRAALVTLEAISLVRASLGVNITYGGSNVSFGLPDRNLINASFLAMAVALGVTCAIVDPLDVDIRKAVAACDLLMGRDEYAGRFLKRSRAGWPREG